VHKHENEIDVDLSSKAEMTVQNQRAVRKGVKLTERYLKIINAINAINAGPIINLKALSKYDMRFITFIPLLFK
jgi:hypothetical protein